MTTNTKPVLPGLIMYVFILIGIGKVLEASDNIRYQGFTVDTVISLMLWLLMTLAGIYAAVRFITIVDELEYYKGIEESQRKEAQRQAQLKSENDPD